MTKTMKHFRAVLRRPGANRNAYLRWAVALAYRARDAAERMERSQGAALSPMRRDVISGVSEGVKALLQSLEPWRSGPQPSDRETLKWTLFLLLRWAWLAERAADKSSSMDPAHLEQELQKLGRDGGYGRQSSHPLAGATWLVLGTYGQCAAASAGIYASSHWFGGTSDFLGAMLGAVSLSLPMVVFGSEDWRTRKLWRSRALLADVLAAEARTLRANPARALTQASVEPRLSTHVEAELPLAQLAGFEDAEVAAPASALERRLIELLSGTSAHRDAYVRWGMVLAQRAHTATERMEHLRRATSSPAHQQVISGVKEGVWALWERLRHWRPTAAGEPHPRWTLFLLLRWACLAERAADENSFRDTSVLERELHQFRRDGGYGGTPRGARVWLTAGAVGAGAMLASGALGALFGCWGSLVGGVCGGTAMSVLVDRLSRGRMTKRAQKALASLRASERRVLDASSAPGILPGLGSGR